MRDLLDGCGRASIAQEVVDDLRLVDWELVRNYAPLVCVDRDALDRYEGVFSERVISFEALDQIITRH